MDEGRGTRTPGRPRTPLLDERRITDAAMRVIREHGASRLTMSRLAERLGVTPAALYNHARSKRVIQRWVEDRLMSMVDLHGLADPDWFTAVTGWARSYHAVMARHDDLVEAIAKTPVSEAPATLAMYEAVTRRLLDAGWPTDAVIPAIVAVESFLYGSAYDAQAPVDLFDTRDGEAEAFTGAVAAHRERVGRGGSAAVFEAGLDALLRGLADAAGVPVGDGPGRPDAVRPPG